MMRFGRLSLFSRNCQTFPRQTSRRGRRLRQRSRRRQQNLGLNHLQKANRREAAKIRSMGFLQLYVRVLAALGADRRLGWLLAIANVAVALALFAEPVLFGRVINVLAAAQADAASADWTRLSILILAWAGVGLCTIVCGTLIALFADRLAHRRRLAVLTSYFEHVLQL